MANTILRTDAKKYEKRKSSSEARTPSGLGITQHALGIWWILCSTWPDTFSNFKETHLKQDHHCASFLTSVTTCRFPSTRAQGYLSPFTKKTTIDTTWPFFWKQHVLPTHTFTSAPTCMSVQLLGEQGKETESQKRPWKAGQDQEESSPSLMLNITSLLSALAATPHSSPLKTSFKLAKAEAWDKKQQMDFSLCQTIAVRGGGGEGGMGHGAGLPEPVCSEVLPEQNWSKCQSWSQEGWQELVKQLKSLLG